MRLYTFEEVPADLSWMPLAARRAVDVAGRKPSLAAWQSLSMEDRRSLATLGSDAQVDVARVDALLVRAAPEPAGVPRRSDPAPERAPSALLEALGPERPLPDAVWTALAPLDRYALVKVAERRQEKLGAAYEEIVGRSAEVSHVDARGNARMVGISEKQVTLRRAVATSRVSMNADAFARLARADAPKGDVLGTARLAGIQGVKRTADLIPLCHPLAVTRVDVRLEPDPSAGAVDVRVSVEAYDRTGVEMEALTGASVAALTIYDMLKAFDRGMSIGPTALESKSGGRSGDFVRPVNEVATARFAVRDTPLSVDEALRLVARPGAGGSVAFVGTVRDHNAEGPVHLLEYQAYEAMAVKELTRVAAEIEAELPGVQLAALHRTGALQVGEIAVVCAASAGHRDAAFRAARLLIDRLKERVPVWKREHGADGPYWVGWQDARPSSTSETRE